MTYAVVYSSKTGNTGLLAQHILKTLGDECLYFGTPSELSEKALRAELIFVGTWIAKGKATGAIASLLKSLKSKNVFIFGTCGFGGSQAYFDQCIERVCTSLDSSCKLVGSFMCQGKMPDVVRVRYEQMLKEAEPESPEAERAQLFLDNFDAALTHPNSDDLALLEQEISNLKHDEPEVQTHEIN